MTDHARSHFPFARGAFLLWLGSDLAKVCEDFPVRDRVEDR